MSIDTNVIYVVDDGRKQLLHLYEVICKQMPDPIMRVCERYLDKWRIKSWTLVDNELLGAGGFTFEADGKVITGYNTMKYYYFTLQNEDGKLLLDAFDYIGQVMGVSQYIICHELLSIEGTNFEEIVANLKREIGLPAKDWSELNESDTFGAASWLIVDVTES